MKEKNPNTPRLAEWLLKLCFRSEDRSHRLGDFEEVFQSLKNTQGRIKAIRWYWWQAVRSAPELMKNSIYWGGAMFRNYLKIAIRQLKRHKGYSSINIVGLAFGMTCFLLIMLWILDEISFDRFHENARTLYRVEQEFKYSEGNFHINVTPYPMSPVLKEEIPEIQDALRVGYTGDVLLKYGEKAFFETNVRAVDPSFLHMFMFPLIKGNVDAALNQPHSLVISEEMAKKYFASENPLGKVVILNNAYQFTVTGVIRNVPHNSFLQFDMLVPFEFMKDMGLYRESWDYNEIFTFVQLHENSITADVEEKISDLSYRHQISLIKDNPDDLKLFVERPRTELMLTAVTDIRLYGYSGYGQITGTIQYVYIFMVIALFVLLIACINFVNLSTARSANRAKEVGLRKVVGALKKHLVVQFYGESILMSLIALGFSLFLILLLLPVFNNLSGKALSINILVSNNFMLGIIGTTLLTGIISGSYPALLLSSFQPARVLKGSLNTGVRSMLFRRALVIIQFSLSILLMIGTVVAYRQLQYMRNMKLGYEKDHLIYIQMRGGTQKSYTTLKAELTKDPRILGVTGTSQRPTQMNSNSGGAEWDGKDPERQVLISFNLVDFDYIKTMKIEMAEGRSFSQEFTSDVSGTFLVNEEVLRLMGVESAVGKRLSFLGVDGTIVGVMKNFHYQSVQNTIEPLALIAVPDNIRYAIIRLQPGDIPASLRYVESTWGEVFPDYPFDYNFLDADFDQMYRADERMSALLQYFAILAVLIACLGLFGLVSFTAEQRTKEIGVRKVLGASMLGIVLLLSKEFARLIGAANIIAWPVAYIVMKNWLQNFAYRASLEWWLFLLVGILALVVALLTVSCQAIRAALANPVNALRYE